MKSIYFRGEHEPLSESEYLKFAQLVSELFDD